MDKGTLRSTVKQRFGISLLPRDGARGQRAYHLSWLQLFLAAATAVASFVLLIVSPQIQEIRWLVVALAVSLFASSLIERRAAGSTTQPTAISGGFDGGTTAITNEAQAKISQLEVHRADYVATMSHELRTPLTSIKGFAQLLAREELPDSKSRAYANTIVAEADRLTRIVDDILALTRMESHVLELRLKPISTEDLVRSLLRRLQPAVVPERMKISLPPYLPWIRGDRERLEQALLQIMLDTIRHAHPEMPLLLAAEAMDGSVVISIGYTAAPERIERMTRALGRIGQFGEDGLSTRLGQGGLGLYISKNLIEAHGGTVRLVHAGGQTAVIAVTLPC